MAQISIKFALAPYDWLIILYDLLQVDEEAASKATAQKSLRELESQLRNVHKYK